MDQLKQALKVAHASTVAFYMKAHNFHFNVEGPLFLQFHQLFEIIYSEVYGSVDQFGEEIRGIGSYTPFSPARVAELSVIEEPQGVVPAQQMIQILMQDNAKMLEVLKVTYEAAEAAGAHGLSNFIAERQDAHVKHGWMLRATSKG
jgi:starvation-inducible DNA-binding protein